GKTRSRHHCNSNKRRVFGPRSARAMIRARGVPRSAGFCIGSQYGRAVVGGFPAAIREALMTDKQADGGDLGFEAELFKAADKLRGNMEPSDYKHVALGLIFLKYISDAFAARHAVLLAEDPQAAENKDEYLADNIFWLPKAGR